MSALVTGATGFIGRHLVSKLVEMGESVTIMVQPQERGSHQLPEPLRSLRPKFHVVYADLRNYNLTARAIRDATANHVFHLAAVGVSDPFLDPHVAIRNNVSGTLNLLRACFESNLVVHRPQQVLAARTPGERSVMNVYAASKAASWCFCQMYARTQGWPILGAMIFQAYGPGQPPHSLVHAASLAALGGEDFPMTSGTQRRDWIYVDDVVSGLVATLQAGLSPGKSIEIGTGQVTSVAEVARMIYKLVGGNGRPLFGVLPNRPGEEVLQVAEVEDAEKQIGWKAKITLTDGLQRTINQVASNC